MVVYHRRRGWRSSLHMRTASGRRVTHVRSNILVVDLTIEGCSTSHGSHSDRVRVHQFSIEGTRVWTLLHYKTQHVAISAISGLLANDLAPFTSGEVVQTLSCPAHDVSLVQWRAMLLPVPRWLLRILYRTFPTDQLCRTHLSSFDGR